MTKKPMCFVQIKRTVLSVLVYLITVPSVSYAGFFREQPSSNNNEHYTNNARTTEKQGGFFRSSSDPDPLDPGSRPDIGEGIGENTPLGSGLGVLLVCSLAFGAMKGLKRRPYFSNSPVTK